MWKVSLCSLINYFPWYEACHSQTFFSLLSLCWCRHFVIVSMHLRTWFWGESEGRLKQLKGWLSVGIQTRYRDEQSRKGKITSNFGDYNRCGDLKKPTRGLKHGEKIWEDTPFEQVAENIQESLGDAIGESISSSIRQRFKLWSVTQIFMFYYCVAKRHS